MKDKDLGEFFPDERLDFGRHELLERAAEMGDFADEGRADLRMPLVGHQEECLDAGEALVGEGHLKLVFEVGKGAEAPD